MIESYTFGRMEVNGHTYTSDLILYPDKVQDSWWRETGHRLSLKDIKDVLKEEPEVIIIGTGFTGLMKVEEEVKQYAQDNGIVLVIKKTKKAVQNFNEIAAKKKTVGAFHLTC